MKKLPRKIETGGVRRRSGHERMDAILTLCGDKSSGPIITDFAKLG